MSSCSNFCDPNASAQAGSGYIQCLLIIAAGLVLFSSSGICGSFSGIQVPYVKKSCTIRIGHTGSDLAATSGSVPCGKTKAYQGVSFPFKPSGCSLHPLQNAEPLCLNQSV